MMIWKQHIFESGNSVVAPLTKQRSHHLLCPATSSCIQHPTGRCHHKSPALD